MLEFSIYCDAFKSVVLFSIKFLLHFDALPAQFVQMNSTTHLVLVFIGNSYSVQQTRHFMLPF